MARHVDPRRIRVPDERVAAILRTKTPEERLTMALECSEMSRRMLIAQIKLRHPDWTPGQVIEELVRRMTG
jgi:hypothetical protein